MRFKSQGGEKRGRSALFFFLPDSNNAIQERKRGANAWKIALWVCYGIANDDLAGALVRQTINASRGISFSARQLYEPSGAARVSACARKTITPIAKEELYDKIICATVVIIFQRRVKILRARRYAKRAFPSKSPLSPSLLSFISLPLSIILFSFLFPLPFSFLFFPVFFFSHPFYISLCTDNEARNAGSHQVNSPRLPNYKT